MSPELPLANNAAGRTLCHRVIARRISYGTRNRHGSRAFTLLASGIEACRQRGHSPWSFIAETLRAWANREEILEAMGVFALFVLSLELFHRQLLKKRGADR